MLVKICFIYRRQYISLPPKLFFLSIQLHRMLCVLCTIKILREKLLCGFDSISEQGTQDLLEQNSGNLDTIMKWTKFRRVLCCFFFLPSAGSFLGSQSRRQREAKVQLASASSHYESTPATTERFDGSEFGFWLELKEDLLTIF